MKFCRFSFLLISKFKYSHFSSLRYFSTQYKNKVLCNKFSNSVLSAQYYSSIVNEYQVNSLLSKSGKLFKENENEYAHSVMENISEYANSVLKPPVFNDTLISETNELHNSYNAIEKFFNITLQNMTVNESLEDAKFANLIDKVLCELPEVSDENLKKILQYLCFWPPAPSTCAPNFKVLWNTLDRECVKRLNQWNVCRNFSGMADKTNHLVFVYGTLKKGEPNHDLIEKRTEGTATSIGNAKTVKKWPLIIASRYNIPYLLFAEGQGMQVTGEVYEVDDTMLAILDELESHPEYYTRLIEEVCLISENERKLLKPWIYFLKNFRPELLCLPCLSNYSSDGLHGLKYVSRYNRTPENYYSDVMVV